MKCARSCSERERVVKMAQKAARTSETPEPTLTTLGGANPTESARSVCAGSRQFETTGQLSAPPISWRIRTRRAPFEPRGETASFWLRRKSVPRRNLPYSRSAWMLSACGNSGSAMVGRTTCHLGDEFDTDLACVSAMSTKYPAAPIASTTAKIPIMIPAVRLVRLLINAICKISNPLKTRYTANKYVRIWIIPTIAALG
jgi:hypothetical protein